jgi:hypothetical protein
VAGQTVSALDDLAGFIRAHADEPGLDSLLLADVR